MHRRPRPTTARRAGDARRSRRRPDERTGLRVRRRHALPGRPLPPLPLQALHRRAPRLRAREADRLLRRRPRQLRVPALRPRRLLLPRLRGRQAAAQPEHYLQLERGRLAGGRAGLRLRPPRPHRAPEHRRRSWSTCATSRYPFVLQRLWRREVHAADLLRAQRPRTRASPRSDLLRRAEQPQGPHRHARRPARPAAHGAASARPRTSPARRGRRRPRAPGASGATPGTQIAAAQTAARGALRALQPRWAARAAASARTLFGIAAHLVRLADGAAQAQRRAPARVPRLRPRRRSSSSSSRRRRSTPSSRSSKLANSLALAGRDARRRRPAGRQQVLGRQVARGARGRAASRARSSPTSAARKRLVEGGAEAVDGLERPDDPARARARWTPRRARCASASRTRSRPSRREAYAQIAAAKFAVDGDERLPRRDLHAAAVLRHGQGLRARTASEVPPFTTFGGPLRARARSTATSRPSTLPARWVEAQGRSSTSRRRSTSSRTADIIGGNSGSPVVNRDGEVVGLIFDGNIQSLVARLRLHRRGRPAPSSVDSRGILAALDQVYGAEALVAELSRSTPRR